MVWRHGMRCGARRDRGRHSTWTRARLLAVVVAIVALAACGGDAGRVAGFPLTSQVLRTVRGERPFALRLGDATAHASCAPADTGRLVPSVSCAALSRASVDSLIVLTGVVKRAMTATPSPDALWAQALLDLLSPARDPRQLDRVIARLRDVQGREPLGAPERAAVANHLAIAHMVRAALREDARDLFAALDYVEQAAAADSSGGALRFNRAMLHGQMGTIRRARQEWGRLLAVERDAGWRAEGERWLAALPREQAASFGEMTTEAVQRDPQGAREYALDSLVPRWGRATTQGDAEQARALYDTLQLAGRELLALRGDSSVWHVAQEMAADASKATVLARAAAQAARGTADYVATMYDSSVARLTPAIADLRSGGATAMADWWELHLAGAFMQQQRYDAAHRHFSGVLDRARARGDRALVARTLWGSGVLVGRAGALDDAERRFAEARRLFREIGESLNAARMLTMVADVQGYMGRAVESATSAYLGFTEAARSERSARYEDHLLVADQLGIEGRRNAALHYTSEAVLVAGTSDRVKDLPEALGRMALAQVALGERAGAERSLARARSLVAAVADTAMRSRLAAELARAELQLVRDRDPEGGVALVNEARRYFASNPIDDAPLLYARGVLALRTGDSSAALVDLANSVRLSRSQAPNVTPQEARALLSTLRDAQRTLVAVALARGDTVAAYAETARLPSLALQESSAPVVASALAKGRAELRFVTLDDRVLVWVRGSGRATVAVVPMRTDSLRVQLARFIDVLRAGEDTTRARDLGRAFYRDFIAPHERQLADITALDVYTDGVLGDLPIGALVDDRGRWLGERFAIEYVVPAGRRRGGGGKVTSSVPLLVGDPSWRREEHPGLEPLRWAEEEVRQVAALYPKSTVITGRAATKATLLAEMPRHAVLHFAGHSRVVVERPETSHLVLASAGRFADGILTAAEIAALDLRGVELVVLSSCGRTRDDASSLGEVNALAVAFLDAGVGRVVASGWEVEDGGGAVLIARTIGVQRESDSARASPRAPPPSRSVGNGFWMFRSSQP